MPSAECAVGFGIVGRRQNKHIGGSNARRLACCSLLCLLVSAGQLQASSSSQPASSPTTDSTPRSSQNTGAEAAPANRELLKNEEQVPDDQKASKAGIAIGKMRDVHLRLLELREEARRNKDVVRLNCVNEKITSAAGLLHASEGAQSALSDALARADHETAQHEYNKISLSQSKAANLRTEGESCVGETTVYSGKTQVTVETGTKNKSGEEQSSEAQLGVARAQPTSPYQ